MQTSKLKILFTASFAAFALEAAAAEAPAAAKPAPASAPAAAAPAAAQAAPAAPKASNCEDVKAAIDAKIKAKGVKAFTLEVVAKDAATDAKVVGNCEAGAKKITYKRG